MKKDEYYDNVKIKGSKEIFKKRKLKSEFFDVEFKKSLGQNFLSNKDVLETICKTASLDKNDNVLEIGTGAGTLTELLCNYTKNVISYEIDKSLKEKLENIEKKYNNLKIIFSDFLNEDINEIFNGEEFKVVANIPYYITTPIIFKLLEISDRINTMIFVVQKEAAERFCSTEGTKSYGVSSIILQSFADVEIVQIIDKNLFIPVPKVDSAIMKIKINHNKYSIDNVDFYEKFIQNCFSMRRKTLINNLNKSYPSFRVELEKILQNLGYDLNIRPENISIINYVKIANLLCKNINK